MELIVGVGGAVLSAWVGGGSELRVQFYKNATFGDEVMEHQAFWDHLQSEVCMSSIINLKQTCYVLKIRENQEAELNLIIKLNSQQIYFN